MCFSCVHARKHLLLQLLSTPAPRTLLHFSCLHEWQHHFLLLIYTAWVHGGRVSEGLAFPRRVTTIRMMGTDCLNLYDKFIQKQIYPLSVPIKKHSKMLLTHQTHSLCKLRSSASGAVSLHRCSRFLPASLCGSSRRTVKPVAAVEEGEWAGMPVLALGCVSAPHRKKRPSPPHSLLATQLHIRREEPHL